MRSRQKIINGKPSSAPLGLAGAPCFARALPAQKPAAKPQVRGLALCASPRGAPIPRK